MTTPVHDRGNRNARGLATARALEQAAVTLASEQGVDEVTVDQICARVGVSQRTFFNHFDTKEDALLGRDLPRIDERRAREYLSDPKAGILTGALGLVEPPAEMLTDPQTAMARMRVLMQSPSLAQRQAARFAPLVGEVEDIIALKLSGVAGPDVGEARIRTAAHVIALIAAALIVQMGPGGRPAMPPSVEAATSQLGDLGWIWDRLL